jgi:hypothetical protein
MHGFWYAFGDHDADTLWEAPDNVSMAAVAVAISAGGAVSSLHDDPAHGRRDVGGARESGIDQVQVTAAIGMTLITAGFALPILVAARRWHGGDRLIRVISGAASFATGFWLAYQVGWIDGLFTNRTLG